MPLTAAERQRRYRAKLRGEVVEQIPRKRGYRQSTEHVAKRVRRGVEHHAWLGDSASVRTGRTRALRLFQDKRKCELCQSEKAERHHKDSNTLNNNPENIQWLCRKCHMKTDGRAVRLGIVGKRNLQKLMGLESK